MLSPSSKKHMVLRTLCASWVKMSQGDGCSLQHYIYSSQEHKEPGAQAKHQQQKQLTLLSTQLAEKETLYRNKIQALKMQAPAQWHKTINGLTNLSEVRQPSTQKVLEQVTENKQQMKSTKHYQNQHSPDHPSTQHCCPPFNQHTLLQRSNPGKSTENIRTPSH